MKKKYVFITLFLILIILFIVLFINSKKLKVTLKNTKVNINEKVYNTDLIKKVKNGKIITKKKLINTSKLGKKKINIKLNNYFNIKENYSYYITVIDNKKPELTFNKTITCTVGDDIDLLKDIKIKDNSKEKIEVKVEGEYDLNKPGEYKLYYIAKDSSKNTVKKEFTLKVNDKTKAIPLNNNTNSSSMTSKGFKVEVKNGVTYIDGYLIANKTYSLPSNYNPGLLENVKKQANIMFNAAKEQGLNIYISSGFRSYSTQASIYNNYVNRDGQTLADTYSARAGHSEHQSGLAFDVNEISNSFDNTPEAIWLSNNAYKYGFILRYPKGKTSETGYQYESWHFRYVGTDLATKLYNDGNWITMESYFGITSQYN